MDRRVTGDILTPRGQKFGDGGLSSKSEIRPLLEIAGIVSFRALTVMAPSIFRLNLAFDKLPAEDFFHDLDGGLGILVDADGFTCDDGFTGIRYGRARKETNDLVVRVRIGREILLDRMRYQARADCLVIIRTCIQQLLDRIKKDDMAKDFDLLERTIEDVIKRVERRRIISYMTGMLPT